MVVVVVAVAVVVAAAAAVVIDIIGSLSELLRDLGIEQFSRRQTEVVL